MKRSILTWMVFVILLAFTSCTEEKIVYVEKEPDTGIQVEGNVLRISLSSSMTRAARPIFDGSAANNINRIGLKFYNPGSKDEISNISIEKVEKIGDTGSIVETQNYSNNIIEIGSACPEEIAITLNMEEVKGQAITIFAYGYNAEGVDDFPFTKYTPTEDDNISLQSNAILLEDTDMDGTTVQEYFAGYKYAVVNDYGRFDESPVIKLTRQVAGLLVYLEKIPVKVNKTDNNPVDVGYITVNAVKKISGLVLPAEALSSSGGNRIDNNGNYANGLTSTNTSEELLRFDLTAITPGPSDLFYEFGENEEAGNNKVLFANNMNASQFSDKLFADNTLFGSCFILPFDHVTYNDSSNGTTALYISYLDDSGDLIKSVYLHMSIDASSSTHSYSIWTNHFYSIGTKVGDADGDSDEDGNPDKDGDEDDPLDISDPSGTKVLKLTVDDVWEDVSLIRPSENE